MSVLHFEYDMEIHYSQPAVRDFFTIKCTPSDDERQRLLCMYMKMIPEVPCRSGKDSFGNDQFYGCILAPHDSFLFHLTGNVETQDSPITGTGNPLQCGIYRYPHGKCQPWSGAAEFLHMLSPGRYTSDYDKCLVILQAMHKRISYIKNSTTVYTTAMEAWDKGCGVCQDFAHIYITLLRMAGIPARYVCGFVTGEGETHAWTEAFCEGKWVALDPTQGCMISDQYIKLGHGRDAVDCSVNRGIIWGGGTQRQLVRASVAEQ